MEPIELLLQAEPKTWPGASKLLATLRAVAGMIEQEIDEEVHRVAVPPPDIQAGIDAKKRQAKALGEKIESVGELSGGGEILDGLHQRALERLFEVGVRKERDLASDLNDDAWDVAAWCDKASEAGLIEQMGTSSAPRRHWKIADKGRESIGYPSAR